MKIGKIQAALSYVHYWESRERGKDMLTRPAAAKQACKNLTDDEKTILLSAIHVKPEEIA